VFLIGVVVGFRDSPAGRQATSWYEQLPQSANQNDRAKATLAFDLLAAAVRGLRQKIRRDSLFSVVSACQNRKIAEGDT
jgi:hypothetical protein